jgi:hypothetical protein
MSYTISLLRFFVDTLQMVSCRYWTKRGTYGIKKQLLSTKHKKMIQKENKKKEKEKKTKAKIQTSQR